jgi:hypothetical protein
MRAEPHSSAEQVSQAILGERVDVLTEEEEWRLIRTPDGYQGWCRERHLAPLERGTTYPKPEMAAVVTWLFAPVVYAPRSDHRMTILTLGTQVEAEPREGSAGWMALRLPGGERGYVESSALIVPEYPPLDELGAGVVAVARGMIGIPYLWGGRTAFGIDCSGMVQRCFQLCGRPLPRDAEQQFDASAAQPVDRKELQPGDLVFFSGGDDRHKRHITHVGISLGGEYMIHAEGSAGVVTGRLSEEPYASRYAGARRINAP